jgi:glucose-1-phosphate adenylyltransferase
MTDMIALILGGGKGTRLFPLTQHRSKPAVPIGGKYRLVDVAISNCLHAGLRRMYVLTQYQSESLNNHIANTYKFDMFSNGLVNVIAAEQTEERSDWFQGTADAVRQSMRHFRPERWKYAAILAGDHLYRMNLRDMLQTHKETNAAATLAMKPVPAEQTSGFGIMKTDDTGRIVHFEEKPSADRLDDLASRVPGSEGKTWLASMGIYIFSRDVLEEALSNDKHIDFGRHVIPAMVSRSRVQAHVYDGYWEDIGTIRSFYDSQIALTGVRSDFSFYDATCPIYTAPLVLPATKIESCTIKDALVCEGCFITGAEIERSVVGIRTRIEAGARVRRSLLLGADFYETPNEMAEGRREGQPPIGIGENSLVERAIIDKNARIGRNVRIVNEAGRKEHDGDGYYIREGIVIVPKGAVIPDGTVI